MKEERRTNTVLQELVAQLREGSDSLPDGSAIEEVPIMGCNPSRPKQAFTPCAGC